MAGGRIAQLERSVYAANALEVRLLGWNSCFSTARTRVGRAGRVLLELYRCFG